MNWVILAALWEQSAGASPAEGFTISVFPEGKDVTAPLFKLGGLGVVSLKSADFGLNLYVFVFLGMSH